MDFVRNWIEKSGYTAALGVALDELTESSARLSLPYSDDNSNPGKVLHGGVAASLSAVGSQAVARAALGPESGPWHICSLQVNYLSAAIGEDVVAEASLLRRGKEMCFVEVDVQTAGGKPIAHATTAVRGRFGAEESLPAHSGGDHGDAEPGPMGPLIGSIPFVGNRGITVEHMSGGTSRLVMPFREENGDSGGGVHEGAVLALLDTTGAMASWAESGPGRYKASTPSIQAQLLMVPPKQDLVAYGSCVRRDREIFFSAVDVATVSDAVLVARGTVIYRILTGA